MKKLLIAVMALVAVTCISCEGSTSTDAITDSIIADSTVDSLVDSCCCCDSLI